MSDAVPATDQVPPKDRSVSTYETHYVELYDVTVRSMIAAGLNPDLLNERYVAGLVRLDEGKWLAVLKYDIGKALGDPP